DNTSFSNFIQVTLNGVLSTGAETLDLSKIHGQVFSILSTNATGTTFTTDNLNTALHVVGGPGNDTVVLQGGNAFSAAQLANFFSQGGSVETVIDANGTHTAPLSVTTLTPNIDTFIGSAGDDYVNGTAGTLNAGDSLDGGAGYDVLQLFGAGSF